MLACHPRSLDFSATSPLHWFNDLIQMKEAAAHFDTQLKTTSKTPEEESSCRSHHAGNTSTPNGALISGGPTPNVTLIALPKNVSSCLIIGRQWIKSAVNESLDLSGLSLPAFDWQENMAGWQPAARRETEINSRSAMATETRWLGLYINGLVRGSNENVKEIKKGGK